MSLSRWHSKWRALKFPSQWLSVLWLWHIPSFPLVTVCFLRSKLSTGEIRWRAFLDLYEFSIFLRIVCFDASKYCIHLSIIFHSSGKRLPSLFFVHFVHRTKSLFHKYLYETNIFENFWWHRSLLWIFLSAIGHLLSANILLHLKRNWRNQEMMISDVFGVTDRNSVKLFAQNRFVITSTDFFGI